jgi:glycosyltransferase involved in cell wall biosynthesis
VTGAATSLGTWALRRLKERTLDAVIAVSAAVARDNRLAASGAPVHVIPNFVADELWEEAGRPLPDGPAPAPLPAGPFLLFVGDLGRDKGLHVLLEAYRLLPEPPPLVLMGRRVADTPSALPAGVTLLADCPHGLVMSALRHCLVAVAPSIWPDPCPTAVLEAMAAGCPLVTTPVGGIPDLVGAESGLVAAPSDAGQLAAALCRLLDDPSLRRRLGAAARQRARGFIAGEVVPRIEAVYRAVTAAGRG